MDDDEVLDGQLQTRGPTRPEAWICLCGAALLVVVHAAVSLSEPGGTWQSWRAAQAVTHERLFATPYVLLTHGLVHASWRELIIVVLGLSVFGPHAERGFGRSRFVVLCLIATVLPALAQALLGPAVALYGSASLVWACCGVNSQFRMTHDPLSDTTRLLAPFLLLLFIVATGSAAWPNSVTGFACGLSMGSLISPDLTDLKTERRAMLSRLWEATNDGVWVWLKIFVLGALGLAAILSYAVAGAGR